jgi:hypothetical protein
MLSWAVQAISRPLLPASTSPGRNPAKAPIAKADVERRGKEAIDAFYIVHCSQERSGAGVALPLVEPARGSGQAAHRIALRNPPLHQVGIERGEQPSAVPHRVRG